MRRPARPSIALHLGQSVVRAVTWLVVLALLNLSVLRVQGAAAAETMAGDLAEITICTSHGLETVALTDLAAEPSQQSEQQCSDCPLCAAPGGFTLPPGPLAGPSVAALQQGVASASGNVGGISLWFLEGRPLRAPPLA